MRYVDFVGDLLHGDMGISALTRAPVIDQVTTALPLTLQLTFLGLGIAVVLSLLGGVTAAIYRDRLPDQIIRVVSLTGVAAPGFWLALLMIQYLAVDLGWFPTGGYINPADSFTGWLRTMTLPALALSLPVAAQLTRIVRTAVVEELDKDYVRTAIGSGLPPRVVVGPQRAAQRAHQPAHRARPARRLSARRRGRHRDDLLPARHGQADDRRREERRPGRRPGRRPDDRGRASSSSTSSSTSCICWSTRD